MILLTTFGPDEKSQIRCVLSVGKTNIEKLIIITSIEENERVKKSLASFTSFLENSSIQYEIIKIDPLNFINSVAKIIYILSSYVDKKILANLSSGDRIVVMETLVALALVGNKAEIEVQSEKGDEKVTFNVLDLSRGDIDKDHLKVLKEIWRGNRSIYKIAKSAGMSTSAVSRKLKKLVKYEYVKKEDSLYYLTPKGMILAMAEDMQEEAT